MSRSRRNFSAEFKTNLVLQLLKGEKELNVFAVENDIQPNLLRNWKKEFLTNASLAFDNKREYNLREKLAEERKEKAEYAKKVGQLTMQVDWLKKKSEYDYDSFGNEVKPDSKDDNPFRYCGEYYDKETGEVYLRARYYQPEAGRFLTRDTYTGESDEPLSLHLYSYCGNDGVNEWDPSGHDEIVVSGGIYKKEKHKQYPYEFIESALKKISDLDRQGKKNIIWYIADNGWTKEEKKKIRQNCRYYTNLVKTHFFVNKKSIIKEFNKKRKKNKVNSITFFCHGQDNKLKLGYDYEKSPSELELNIRDIKKIKPKRGLFWDVNTWFYSCNTATDGKKSFAYKWFKRVGGTVIAYKNYTDYAGINDNGAGIVEKIVLRLLGVGRYHPQQSINYPTCDIDDLVEYKVPRYSPVRK